MKKFEPFTLKSSWNEIMEWLDRNTDDREDGSTGKFIAYLVRHYSVANFQSCLSLADKPGVISIINHFGEDVETIV